jgi:hypothetical protein
MLLFLEHWTDIASIGTPAVGILRPKASQLVRWSIKPRETKRSICPITRYDGSFNLLACRVSGQAGPRLGFRVGKAAELGQDP